MTPSKHILQVAGLAIIVVCLAGQPMASAAETAPSKMLLLTETVGSISQIDAPPPSIKNWEVFGQGRNMKSLSQTLRLRGQNDESRRGCHKAVADEDHPLSTDLRRVGAAQLRPCYYRPSRAAFAAEQQAVMPAETFPWTSKFARPI